MRTILAASAIVLLSTAAGAAPESGMILAAGDNVAPGSGNWGGGPGNSGPGDKNGQNDKSKDGGQTPNDDKLFDDGPDWLKGFVLAQGYDKDSPTDGNNGQGNDPGKSGKAPGHDKR